MSKSNGEVVSVKITPNEKGNLRGSSPTPRWSSMAKPARSAV
jgi:hypothetical protein